MIAIEDAIEMLPDTEGIHVFHNPSGILMGRTWAKEDIVDLIERSGQIAVSGELARSLGHGMAVYYGDGNEHVFIETKEELE